MPWSVAAKRAFGSFRACINVHHYRLSRVSLTKSHAMCRNVLSSTPNSTTPTVSSGLLLPTVLLRRYPSSELSPMPPAPHCIPTCLPSWLVSVSLAGPPPLLLSAVCSPRFELHCHVFPYVLPHTRRAARPCNPSASPLHAAPRLEWCLPTALPLFAMPSLVLVRIRPGFSDNDRWS